MQDLIAQEKFELEALDHLNSHRLLGSLIFVGGTMLRLCHGLDRYSVDLDFWTSQRAGGAGLFKKMEKALRARYQMKDAAEKRFTWLFEIRSREFPQSLKIEIRREPKSVRAETSIAFRPHSIHQVRLQTASLQDMMNSKIDAFLSRQEIRDVFDMEFLLKRGALLAAPAGRLEAVDQGIAALSKKDYSVKLGSLLEPGQRRYYQAENFKILRAALRTLLSKSS